jgi:16S rRNA (cytosine967-C5)-methyltransferase
MPVSPARRLAYRVLHRVESGPDFAADLLRAAAEPLSEADRHLATEIVLGVLRRRALLDDLLARLSGRPLSYFDPEVIAILRIAAYQICFLKRIPKSAVVNEAVEMTKLARKGSAAGLVNAVLRKCGPSTVAPDTDEHTGRLALPAWLFERWERRFGLDAALSLARRTLETPVTVVRAVDGDIARVREELASAGIEARSAKYAPDALVVESGKITKSEAWLAGRVVIQEEASQLVGSLVKPHCGQRLLDLCAAPGMKSAQIAAELHEGTMILCDRSGPRLRSMQITRLVPAAVEWSAVQLDAANPLPFNIRFDRILLDAPCSGTGTLRRNPEIKWRLTPGDITRLAAAQVLMLRHALEALAPGGRLVYATCSLEPEENEQVVETVLTDQREFTVLPRTRSAEEWPHREGLFDERGYFRTRPDLQDTDGFFAAVIERMALL